jgi:predicted O-methyltransferase YrrM
MQHISKSELGVQPIKGPFSYYLNQYETAILIALVKSVAPKVMIEFGCNLGMTARRVLDNVPTLDRYIGIDAPHDHKPPLACQQSEVPKEPGRFAANDERFWLLLTTLPLPEDLEPCDAAFIDGDHSAEGVRRDTILARALIRPGGIIVWHDAGNKNVEVTPVLERLCEQGWPIHHVEGSWIAFCRV